MWVESQNMVHVLEHEIPDMDPEQINRNVMDRIYRDFHGWWRKRLRVGR